MPFFIFQLGKFYFDLVMNVLETFLSVGGNNNKKALCAKLFFYRGFCNKQVGFVIQQIKILSPNQDITKTSCRFEIIHSQS